MKKIGHAIIGGGYGDEGKGLMTDFLTRKLTRDCRAPITVRCNGGAQAGHTVVDGQRRHVFGHIGSGTFAAASTFLSSKFIVNPFALSEEFQELMNIGIRPIIEIHPSCEITTGFDIVLNRLRELSRGANVHGSCGLGINETVTRALAGHSLTVDTLTSLRILETVKEIYNEWWLPEFEKIDLSAIDPSVTAPLIEIFKDVNTEIQNLQYAKIDLSRWATVRPTQNHSDKNRYVFEGAQGLELDEFLGEFPHVTRSVTGLPSALQAAYEVGVTEITPVYVTRCYKTRHGAGPLPFEDEQFSEGPRITDATNITGQWQGEFRMAPLHIGHLKQKITKDLIRSVSLAQFLGIKINRPEIALTCLDQVSNRVRIIDGGGESDWVTGDELVARLSRAICPVKYLSYGPSADCIVEVK